MRVKETQVLMIYRIELVFKNHVLLTGLNIKLGCVRHELRYIM